MKADRQRRAPLYEALVRHKKRNPGNFHVPGHKQGRVFDEEGLKLFGSVLSIDLTELSPLDDLHDPAGVIAEAQALAAEAFGADETFFLVGGSTAGNLAAILSCCIREMCCWCSAVPINRCFTPACWPGCVRCIWEPGWMKRAAWIRGSIRRFWRRLWNVSQRPKAVVVTSPSYHGVVQPIDRFADLCHARGIPLIVDEAHGAHFGFHPYLPPPAIRSGADLAVQSTHKMLPAMTMASMLHLRGKRIRRERLTRWLRILQSSSPSYPLMASLDLARKLAATEGRERLEDVLSGLAAIRERIGGLRRLSEAVGPLPQDPLKLSLQSERGTSGFRMAEWLESRDCFPEMADHRRVLFTFSLARPGRAEERLLSLLSELDEQSGRNAAGTPRFPFPPFSGGGWGKG